MEILRALGALGLLLGLSGWGSTGHRVVGEIAERRLRPETKAAVLRLLDGASLAEASTWADEIRSQPEWKKAAPWHYISSEDGAPLVIPGRTDEAGVRDILGAILYFESVLRGTSRPKKERAEALKFLAHFVGDLHMPLHVGRAADAGGNKIQVRWFGQPSNLHQVWDDKILEQTHLSFTELVRFIDRVKPAEAREWEGSTLLQWAQESKDLRAKCYEYTGRELSWEYFEANREVVFSRLARAGVRLSSVIERAIGS